MNTDNIKTMLTKEKTIETMDWDSGLSTGSTLLNLAISGRPNIGFAPGGLYLFVGDSSSGKTFLSLTCMAEAANNPRYDQYQLVFDNAENGALMDFSRFFGHKMANRIQPPKRDDDGKPVNSSTVESFYFNLYDVLANGPTIYVLDSMDVLTTGEEVDKFQEQKEAAEKGKETTGTFGTSKPKLNSGMVRAVYNTLRETKSICIVICQTRSNIGFGAQFNPKTRSGGHALTFYNHVEIWSSVKEHLKVTYKGKPREQGIVCKLHVKKNRVTGRDRKVEVPIFHSFGIDDVGSLVDWLVDEGEWSETKGKITAKTFDFSGSREKLIQYIQDHNLENQLKGTVHDVWTGIEEAIQVERKPRYA